MYEIRDTLQSKIESFREDLLAVNRLLNRFDQVGVSLGVAGTNDKEGITAKTIKPVIVKKKTKSKDDSGKIRFSKYMLDIMKDNPDKEFDLNELGEAMTKGIESGEVFKITGKVKDEVAKRMYQFKKRGDIIRTISGAYQYCLRSDAIRE